MTICWPRPHPEAAEGEVGRARWVPTPTRPIVVGHFPGTVVVTLHGDLDLAGAVGLARVPRDDNRAGVAVVVDLGGVGWIDRSGADVLASAATRVAADGGHLQLGGPTRAVFDALAHGGLSGSSAPRSSRHRAQRPRGGAVTSHPAGRPSPLDPTAPTGPTTQRRETQS